MRIDRFVCKWEKQKTSLHLAQSKVLFTNDETGQESSLHRHSSNLQKRLLMHLFIQNRAIFLDSFQRQRMTMVELNNRDFQWFSAVRYNVDNT